MSIAHLELEEKTIRDSVDMLLVTEPGGVSKKISNANFTNIPHDHDDRYYTESEADTLLAGKSDDGHDHDDRYYTEAEIDAFLAGLGNNLPYVLLRDTKITGTNGGSFMSGARRTRDLNEELIDTDDICSLSSSQFTLPAGTYRIFVSCPAYYVGRHQIYLRNVSDSIDEAIGSSEFAYYGIHEVSRSFLSMRFTISASKIFEIQHECEDDAADYGFGVAAGFGPYEVYTIVEIWKEG